MMSGDLVEQSLSMVFTERHLKVVIQFVKVCKIEA